MAAQLGVFNDCKRSVWIYLRNLQECKSKEGLYTNGGNKPRSGGGWSGDITHVT